MSFAQWMFLVGTPLALFGSVFVGRGWSYAAALKLVRSTRTTRAGDARKGLVELKGTLQALGQPLHSPTTQTSCVQYELWGERRGDGRAGNLWKLDRQRRAVRAALADDSGEIEVDLSTAFIQPGAAALLGARDDSARGRALGDNLATATGRPRRPGVTYVETALPDGCEAYVIGTVTRRRGGGRAIGGGFLTPFVVSDLSEQKLSAYFARACALNLAVGVAITLLGVAIVVTG